MLATISAGRFAAAAAWVARIAPSKHSNPILQGMIVDAKDDVVRLSAYDLDTAGTATVEAVVQQRGRALVSGRLLAAIGKTLDVKKDVSLNYDGDKVRITQGRSVWTLPTLILEDFPIMPLVGDVAAKIDSATLRRAVSRVLPAAHRMHVDPIRGTVKFVFAGQSLTITALDGHRLAVAKIDAILSKIDTEIDILVPSEFLDAIKAALGSESHAAEFGVSPGAIALGTPSQRLTGRLGAGKWPSLETILPSVDAPIQAIFVVADLTTALDRATALSDDENAIALTMSSDGFEFESLTATGMATAEAAIAEFVGETKRIGIKPRYLRAALNSLESDRAVLRTRPHMRGPLDIVPLDDDGNPVDDFRHVMMPVDPGKVTMKS
jgi:DNA polymerase III subunit beta